MYTGGVSSLAEQIANQLQRRDQPKTLLGKKELGSLKKEFPPNVGGSDVCYFCHKRVYVMERLSAEGKFFHRSCFKCEYCATTLRLSSYAYDLVDGKFYCKPHYCYRLSGYAQRKRPAVGPLSGKDNKGTQQDTMAADGAGRASSISASSERTPGSSASLFGRVVQYSVRLFDKVRVASQLLQGTASSLGHLVAQNPLDSFFMCQLMAFGVPFLYVQSEVLAQILGEFLSALGY
ncbi:UNVERIFIED_CONTAM: [F-actin]-monooxygenase mical3 [Gekko kuhli]